MTILGSLKKLFKSGSPGQAEMLALYSAIKFKVVVIDFLDNVESSGGENLARLLSSQENLTLSFFDENFPKGFLNLESRTLFDLIDRGQTIIDKTGADVIIWGYRDNDRIRLNFQTEQQYENEDCAYISLLDSFYFPAKMFEQPDQFPPAILNLIYGAVISSLNTSNAAAKIQKRYLLKKIIDKLSKDNSAKAVSVEYMPYIMNFLGIIYLSYAYDNRDEKDFKITKSLFETAIKHQDLITSPLHLGCIYYHLGQLYDCGTRYMENRPASYFKGAIEYYRQAQRYLGKYTYPYDYGYISYKLSHLFFNYWRQKDDLQALRDAVFQLREAEKIYTYALFPNFWAVIQGELGQMLGLLGNLTKSEDISELAVNCYRNQQKVITERRDPITWAAAQESIGEIYYRIGKNSQDRAHLEDALECYHDALYIFENSGNEEKIKNIMVNIARTNQALNMI